MLFTEFGADAFNAVTSSENQKPQAKYLLENWKEIYANAAGMGGYENTIGGFTFQFSDGWWKYDFDHRKNVSKHDTIATWVNGGYSQDLSEGKNNMNEEWFGICAKGPTDDKGLYNLYPRAAYYVLKQVHQFNPFNDGVSSSDLQKYFHDIDLKKAVAKGNQNKKNLVFETDSDNGKDPNINFYCKILLDNKVKAKSRDVSKKKAEEKAAKRAVHLLKK